MTFRIGQRVMCTKMNIIPYSSMTTMVGYYGHVNYIAPIDNFIADGSKNIIGVDLAGLTAEARARDESNGEDVDDFLGEARRKPWPFFEHELSAAD